MELSAKNIHSQLSESIPFRTIKRDLSTLEEYGFVERIGKSRNTLSVEEKY